MGGPGSTRWRGHTPKPIAEHTLHLDFLELSLGGTFQKQRADGTIRWFDAHGYLVLAPTFHVGPAEDDARQLILRFSEDPYEPKEWMIVQRVQHGFGSRWYGRCRDCGRAVRKLYQKARWVSGQTRFGCQKCAGVVYESVQRHDRRVDEMRRAPHAAMAYRAGLRGFYSQLVTAGLIWKAAQRGFKWPGPNELLDLLIAEAPPEDRATLERMKRRDRRRRLPRASSPPTASAER